MGFGTAGGGNLSSHDSVAALDAIFDAISAALSATSPANVRFGLIGTAGSGNLHRPDIAAELSRRWSDSGLTCPYEIVSDGIVAFAAGTDQPDGTLILAGTGAVTAALVDRTMTTTVDGHGWLVGDLGSAFWLGREAVVHTLRTLDLGLDPTPLVTAVLNHYRIAAPMHPAPPRHVQAEIEVAIYRDAPVHLARLAPLVTSLVDRDPAAARIVTEAAGHLVQAASLVRDASDASPVVLAGSLLTAETPVATAVREQVRRSWPDAPIGEARDGASAAAWLALVHSGLIADDAAARAHKVAVGH